MLDASISLGKLRVDQSSSLAAPKSLRDAFDQYVNNKLTGADRTLIENCKF